MSEAPTAEEVEAAVEASCGELWWDGAAFHCVPRDEDED
jgi:hypothetical protein